MIKQTQIITLTHFKTQFITLTHFITEFITLMHFIMRKRNFNIFHIAFYNGFYNVYAFLTLNLSITHFITLFMAPRFL